MEHLAPSSELPVFADSTDASGGRSEPGEGIGLGALLIVLTPFGLAAWFALGLAAFRVVI